MALICMYMHTSMQTCMHANKMPTGMHDVKDIDISLSDHLSMLSMAIVNKSLSTVIVLREWQRLFQCLNRKITRKLSISVYSHTYL